MHDEPDALPGADDDVAAPRLPSGVQLSDPTWWESPEAGGEDALLARIAELREGDPAGRLDDSAGQRAHDADAPDGPDGLDGLGAVTPRAAPRAARRRPRRLVAVVAAAGLVAAAVALVAVGYAWGARDPGPRGVEVALGATGLQPAAAAVARVDETANGTWIRLDVTALSPAAPGEYYEAWLGGPDGWVSAGTFHMRGEPGPVVLWAGVSPTAYPLVDVTVQTEGDPVRSDRVVLEGSLGT